MKQNLFVGLVALAAMFSTSISSYARETENTYHATFVKQCNSQRYGERMYTDYSLLGTNNEGYEIWGHVFDGSYFPAYKAETMWFIDNTSKWDYRISGSVGVFNHNIVYHLDRDYDVYCNQEFLNDGSTHFIKVKNRQSADYVSWKHTDDINSDAVKKWTNDWYITGNLYLTLEYPTYFPEKNDYRVWLTWRSDGFNDEVFDHVEFVARYDDGSEYTQVLTSDKSSGNSFIRVGDITKKMVEVKGIVHLKDQYAPLYDAEKSLRCEPQTCELKTCDTEFRVTSMRDNFEPSNGTYTAFLEWSCPEVYTDFINKIEVDYSVDEGKTWKQGISGAGYKGSDSGKISTILPGYHKYIFRYQGMRNYGDETVTYYAEAYDTIEINYDPQVVRFELAGKITDDYDEQTNTYKPTIGYMFNRDLYEMCADKTTIEYSINGGEFVEATKFLPEAYGMQQISIPADGKTYQFRMKVTATCEGKWTSYEALSPVYQRFTGVDDIEADNNTPVDVYTLDGKVIAKQILPADAKTSLANGTYIIGGQKIIIKK